MPEAKNQPAGTFRHNLTADEWRTLRVVAAERGVSVAAYVTEVLRRHLQQSRRPRKR